MEHFENIVHEFEPVYNEQSKILILGTFPSVKSRAAGFYYYHPQNRFWKVIAGILEVPVPQTIEEKKVMLLEHKIAIWDVISSCSIDGSSDASIRDVVPADIPGVLKDSSITKIYANGGKARQLYDKYTYDKTGIRITGLPSTSPANAAWSLERLVNEWKQIRDFL